MYPKKIKFEDYNGVQQERTYMFNMTQAELTEMNYEAEGGFQEYVQKIQETKDEKEIVKFMKKLILMSYGEKSGDGQRFVKIAPDGHRLADDFAQTEAYSELFMELATDTNAAIDFIIGVLPAKVKSQITPQQIADVKTGAMDIQQITAQN